MYMLRQKTEIQEKRLKKKNRKVKRKLGLDILIATAAI